MSELNDDKKFTLTDEDGNIVTVPDPVKLSKRKLTELFSLEKFVRDNLNIERYTAEVQYWGKVVEDHMEGCKGDFNEKVEEHEDRLNDIEQVNKDQDGALEDLVSNIDELHVEIDNVEGSLEEHIDTMGGYDSPGHVSLSDHTTSQSSVSDGVAATPKAVADVNERINVHGATIASKTELGHVKVGDGITLASDGTISVEVGGIEPATPSKIGGVKVGSGLSVKSDGTLSTDKATSSDAKNGTNNTKTMTPLRVLEAIDTHASTKFDMDGKTYKYGFELNSDKDGLVFVYEEDK